MVYLTIIGSSFPYLSLQFCDDELLAASISIASQGN